MFGRKLPEVTEPPLQTATSVMERYSRIEGAIEIEVGNLRPLILELLAADKELQTSETAVVLNEQPSVTPAKAAKRVDAAKSAIDGAGRKLEGLRSRLLTITALAPAAYDQLLRTMPALNAAIRRDFEAEWSAAVASFSAALGKRRALEALVGEPFSLPDPSPAPVELSPEITRPHRRLAGLKASIESAHRHSPRASAKDVDPYKVYVLRRPTRDLPVGTLLVAGALPVGKLASLIEAEYAAAWTDPDVLAAANIARNAKREMDAAARQRSRDEADAAGRKRVEELGIRPYTGGHGIPVQAGGAPPAMSPGLQSLMPE